jgi:TonB family protein
MATGAQTRGWGGPSRRRVPRFEVQAPLDVTALRSGIPDTMPGRSVNLCERGIAAMLAGELVPGESVGLELRLPLLADSLRTRAMVRYQDKLRCGLEFVGLSAEQRAVIRDWAKEAKSETEIGVSAPPAAVASASISPASPPSASAKKETANGGGGGTTSGGAPRRPKKKRGWIAVVVLLLLAAIAGGAFWWWRWNKGWEELESGLGNPEVVAAEKPQAQVAAEVMEKLLVHRVEPAYPAEARKADLQGVIALDIVVGRDGSVVGMHPLNGPDVLARAAMDALRWWKFEPYRVNGEPAVVETTVAVEFKK